MDIDELKNRYKGSRVSNYDEKRANTPHWKAESAAVEKFLSRFKGLQVLDVPVGTGRFMALYASFAMTVVGLDSSAEMLAAARAKAGQYGTKIKLLETANALKLDPVRYAADVAVVVRFMNWLDPEHAELALSNIVRASPCVIVGIRAVDIDAVSPEHRALQLERIQTERNSPKGTKVNYLHMKSEVNGWFATTGVSVVDMVEIQLGGRGANSVMYLLSR